MGPQPDAKVMMRPPTWPYRYMRMTGGLKALAAPVAHTWSVPAFFTTKIWK